MKTYNKEALIVALKAIRQQGWIADAREGNVGGVGNTVEDLLGIEENNLPLANAGEWELKCQRKNTGALTTLFHMEPSPRALRFVPKLFLPNYGWQHAQAGTKYPAGEMSFRQTIRGLSRSDRGFGVVIDKDNEKVLVSFDAEAVDAKHKRWRDSVEMLVGLDELNPQPYWGFNDLFHKAATKLLNCFYLQAESKKIQGQTHFFYKDIMILQGLGKDKFISALENGNVYVDFDARSGHNHGTKIRMRKNYLPSLYDDVQTI